MIREWLHKKRMNGLSIGYWRLFTGLCAAMGIALVAILRSNVRVISFAAGACIGGAVMSSIGLSYAILIDKARKMYGDDFLKDF